MSDSTARGAGFDPKRGRWIPWIFVGGMVLVFVVNAIMAYVAISTFTGVTTAQSYDRGRSYNLVLQEAARQDALGWSARVTLEGDSLLVTLTDGEGRPVIGRLEGVLARPLSRETLALEFGTLGAGRFVAQAGATAAGQWEARLVFHGRGGERLDIRQRVFAP